MGGKRRAILIGAIMLGLLVGGMFTERQRPHIQVPAEHIASVFGFSITNTLLATWLAMLLLVAFAIAATARMQLVPGRLQNLGEFIVEALLGLTTMVAGPHYGRRFFPLVATIFIFLLTANWMGLLPGFGTIGIWEQEHSDPVLIPYLRSAATDLNTTVALALIAVVMTQYFGVRAFGFLGYGSRFVNVGRLLRPRRITDLLLGAIDVFVGILETITEFAKIISFSFRLFGNIFAGEVLLGVIMFLIPWVAVLPFFGLEFLVGTIQAFVFAGLTLAFMTAATAGHSESHA